MAIQFGSNGNEESKGKIAVTEILPGCSVFLPSRDEPTADEDMPIALVGVVQKWIKDTGAQVHATLPITRAGNTVALFVWWDAPRTDPAQASSE